MLTIPYAIPETAPMLQVPPPIQPVPKSVDLLCQLAPSEEYQKLVIAGIMGEVTPFKCLKFYKLLGCPNVEVHAGSNLLQWTRHTYSSIRIMKTNNPYAIPPIAGAPITINDTLIAS